MKRTILSTLLALVLVLSMALSASAAIELPKGPTGEVFDTSVYDGADTSEPVTIHWYALGDVPPDLDLVLEEANSKYFEPVLNCKLDVRFLSWSDYATKYSLVLAGGEDCDLIYTASWCYFQQEALKGAFLDLSQEFLDQYMPLTVQNQATDSWEQVSVGGKIYAVTRNKVPLPNYKFLAIREDLREKYDLPPVEDKDSFEEYLFTIAEKEQGVQALAAAGNNWELRDILCLQQNKLYSINATNYNYVWQATDDLAAPPKPEEVEFLFTTDGYRDFVMMCKEWADKGVWSKNAVNNTISTADAYEQGKSASLPWVDAVFQRGKNLEAAHLGVADYVDITRHITPRVTVYNGDCMAITRNSKNPERAAMLLDFVKNCKDLNLLIMGGIEGKHWIYNEDGTRSEGPDAERFQWDSFAWGVRNSWNPEEANRDPREMKIVNDLKAREKPVAIDGFGFDETPVKAELAVIIALVDEYNPSLELGMFGDGTEAKLNEFIDKLNEAGLEKVMTEFRSQYGAFLAEKGLA